MRTPAELTSDFVEVRRQLSAADRRSTAGLRAELAAATKTWLAELARTVLPGSGYSLVAVGGLGRAELCAGSDLDLLLLHANDAADVSVVADRLWYPIWDAGVRLDHSVRNPAQARDLAGKDFKVLIGLLDATVIWGEVERLEQLRSSVLADWRAQANRRLPQLRESVQERRERAGELPHLLEPDLKESYGGLRELTVLRAIAASWVTDLPRREIAAAGESLLQVRDALHRVTQRPADRLLMQEQAAVAKLQGFGSDDELLRAVSMAGRAIATASDLAWHRADRLLASSKRGRLFRREPDRRPLADGVVLQDGEVVLAKDAQPQHDPVLVLRAAAAAAQSGLVLSPHAVGRLAADSRPLAAPWPADARDALVSLLGAGRSMVPVWESLDQAGLIERLLPHWSGIRALPQRNSLHVYTVDRHSVETAVEAARFARDVQRPDLLLVAALFHDIGKGAPGHCERGAELMQVVGPTLGFDAADTEVLSRLVRQHLLLAETAVARDLDDPATIEQVAQSVGSQAVLELLVALTLADSKAASPGVLTAWKQRLIGDLAARVSAVLAGERPPPAEPLAQRLSFAVAAGATRIEITGDERHAIVEVMAPDRIGLLADIAAGFALERIEVRMADFETVEGIALQRWEVQPAFGTLPSPAELRRGLQQALDHPELSAVRVQQLQPLTRSRGFVPPPPRVRAIPTASSRATLLEVRAHDAPALLHKVAWSIAQVGFAISSARATTLGSEVVDALYLQTAGGAPLTDEMSTKVIAAVEAALAAE